jgi:hypothetical protein
MGDVGTEVGVGAVARATEQGSGGGGGEASGGGCDLLVVFF